MTYSYNGTYIFGTTLHDKEGWAKRLSVTLINPDHRSAVLGIELTTYNDGVRVMSGIGLIPSDGNRSQMLRSVNEHIGWKGHSSFPWEKTQRFLRRHSRERDLPETYSVWSNHHGSTVERSLAELITILRQTDLLSTNPEARNALCDVVQRTVTGEVKTQHADDQQLRSHASRLWSAHRHLENVKISIY